MELDLKPIELPGIEKKRPMIIAGPCKCRNRRTSNGYRHYAGQ